MKVNTLNHFIIFIRSCWLNLIPPILAIAVVFSILILSKSLPPKLPLFYSLAWGDTQLVSSQQLFIIPSIIVLITLFNLILTWQLHSSQVFFKRILLFSSLLVSIILTITFFKIVLIFL